jgi:8-oxo-dGTP pyrophosphatase MutT (NUDIX family)
MRWTVHGERSLYRDRWVHLRSADVELPNGDHLDHRLIHTSGPGAGLLVINDGKVLLIWRHRFITDTYGWEIPMGMIEPGEEPATAAVRETLEETGWRATGEVEPLLRTEPYPGLMACEDHLFRAAGATYVGPPADDFESDKVDWVPMTEILALIKKRHISAGSTLNALLFALAIRDEAP